MFVADHFVILDGNALVHRSFHALPPLTNKKGEPTGAIYGFFLVLMKILAEEKPKYLAATFDLKGPTLRHKKYKEYKAKRVKAPDELYVQFEPIKQLLRLFGIPIYEKQDYEADDVIGTLARLAKETPEQPIVDIVTGDLDTLQLVNEKTRVLAFVRGTKETNIYDEQAVEARYGLKPEQIVDYKALHGDASDNIPGVAGIGAKSASNLLAQYGSLENIYLHLAEVKESWRKKLTENKEMAFLSKELVTIDQAVPLEFKLTDCQLGRRGDFAAIKRGFAELNFATLNKRLQQIGEQYFPKQETLF